MKNKTNCEVLNNVKKPDSYLELYNLNKKNKNHDCIWDGNECKTSNSASCEDGKNKNSCMKISNSQIFKCIWTKNKCKSTNITN